MIKNRRRRLPSRCRLCRLSNLPRVLTVILASLCVIYVVVAPTIYQSPDYVGLQRKTEEELGKVADPPCRQ